MPLFLIGAAASSGSGLASLGIIFVLLVAIFVICFVIALIGCLFRTAKATEETHRTLERILKIVEAVARKEHPELYGKSENSESTTDSSEQPQ